MILVDTSIWIPWLRRGEPPSWREHLAGLFARDEAALAEPVIAELLQGARGARERKVILDLAGSAPILPLDLALWVAAGDLSAARRRQGQALPLVDCLLAELARRHAIPLWTADQDFLPLVAEGYVTTWAPPR